MNGGFSHFTRDELLAHLEQWNRELAGNQADVLCSLDAAHDLPDTVLRDVLAGTASRLGQVVRVLGEST